MNKMSSIHQLEDVGRVDAVKKGQYIKEMSKKGQYIKEMSSFDSVNFRQSS